VVLVLKKLRKIQVVFALWHSLNYQEISVDLVLQLDAEALNYEDCELDRDAFRMIYSRMIQSDSKQLQNRDGVASTRNGYFTKGPKQRLCLIVMS
jgi:hypothetical protein